jgi:hypothetical protein
LARLVTWIVALVVGLVYGTAGTVAHAFTVGGFPLGLILAVIGVAALLAAVRLLTTDRWACLATGLGVMLAALVFSGPGPGGSVVVAAAAEGQFPLGIVWTVAVPLVVAVAVAWPDTSVRSAPRAN